SVVVPRSCWRRDQVAPQLLETCTRRRSSLAVARWAKAYRKVMRTLAAALMSKLPETSSATWPLMAEVFRARTLLLPLNAAAVVMAKVLLLCWSTTAQGEAPMFG